MVGVRRTFAPLLTLASLLTHSLSCTPEGPAGGSSATEPGSGGSSGGTSAGSAAASGTSAGSSTEGSAGGPTGAATGVTGEGTTGATTGVTGEGTSGAATGDATSGDTTSGDATTGGGGCAYELVYEQAGELLTMTYENSYYAVSPLAPGQSFDCLRLEFDMVTADTLEQTLMDFPGCPIYTTIAGVRGDTKAGKLLAGALFKYYKVGCTPGPDRLEMDTFVEGVVTEGPWPIGETYHFEITVEPFTATVRAFQGGAQVGPAVQASIEGATLEHARDPVIEFGLEKPAGDAYFPNYGGSYHDLKVWASVAP